MILYVHIPDKVDVVANLRRYVSHTLRVTVCNNMLNRKLVPMQTRLTKTAMTKYQKGVRKKT